MTPAVTVIGCDGSPLPAEAAAAIGAASLVIGARLHLGSVTIPGGAKRSELTRLHDALAEICQAPGPVAVLASGDPGFFGIVRSLRARGVLPRVIPLSRQWRWRSPGSAWTGTMHWCSQRTAGSRGRSSRRPWRIPRSRSSPSPVRPPRS